MKDGIYFIPIDKHINNRTIKSFPNGEQAKGAGIDWIQVQDTSE